MSRMKELDRWLPHRLEELAGLHRVPGAVVGVLDHGETFHTATGVVNRATGVGTTTDTLFQVGSITKVWTATLAMQLVDEGVLELDAPVRAYLPQFRVADAAVSETITVRQLTTHTSGFEGDIFVDTGRNADAVERFLDALADVPQLFSPGSRFSYNNAGYVVLGRIIEVLRGQSYGQVLHDRIADPLELTHLAVDAEEAILHRSVVGHIAPEPDTAPEPTPVWSMVSSNAPAGALLSMSTGELLRFVRTHLDATGDQGSSILSAAAGKAMQAPLVEATAMGPAGTRWGIGWELWDRPGGRVIGHNGSTIGQSAYLRVVPDARVAVALLTNGGDTTPVYEALFAELLDTLAGVEMPVSPQPPAAPVPFRPERYVGRYTSRVVAHDVHADDDGGMWLETEQMGTTARLKAPQPPRQIVCAGGDTFIPLEPEDGVHRRLEFVVEPGQTRASFLHTGRAVARAGT